MKLVDGLSPAAQAAVIARHGAVEQSAVAALRIHVAQVPAAELAQALQAFAADPQVESVEAVKTRRAEWLSNDAYVGEQWSLTRIGWPTVYSTLTPTGTATVALLDTGVDGTHPDLQGNLSPGASLLDDGDGLTDPAGHGTQLAGLIAAVADNQQGIAGVAFSGVKVMPVRVLDAAGVGQDSAIVAGAAALAEVYGRSTSTALAAAEGGGGTHSVRMRHKSLPGLSHLDGSGLILWKDGPFQSIAVGV